MRQLAALTALCAASMGFNYDFGSYPSRGDWSHIKHTYREKPLTKRQKRRLRGKAKP